MKSPILVLYLLFQLQASQAQDILCAHDQLTLDDKILLSSKYSIESNITAYKYINRIMNESNLPMNFVVQKINKANNAFAYMDNSGTRYILYDDIFLESLNSDSTRTEFITVLAHEIGHHLAGHSLAIENFINQDSCFLWCNPENANYDPQKKITNCVDYLKDRRNKELEADIFAGYIMSKIGANMSKVKNTFFQISSNKDDRYSTHPKLDKRLKSIEQGYEIANNNILGIINIIQKIRGDSTEYRNIDYSEIERNQLISKVLTHATHKPLQILSSKTTLSIGIGAKYPIEGKVDNDLQFIQPFSATIILNDLKNINVENLFYLKIENEILYLIINHNEKEKVIYTSIFSEDKISFSEITNLFTVVYETLIQDAIEKNYRNR